MNANPFLGVFLHALGGLAAGSFYIPFKRVKKWSWESYWLVNGFLSWVIVPWVVFFIVCPDVCDFYKEVFRDILLKESLIRGSLIWSYVFGVLWGIGGLTFGLSMRYLGMSLGYALALGCCAAFGTIIPPLFQGTIMDLVSKLSGLVILAGVFVCLLGIAVCGLAGVLKERELSADQKKATIKEFNFAKGFWVAIFAGVMSACMAFAIAAGKPIAELAVKQGVDPLWQITPTYIVIFAGGFTTNLLWCLYLNIRNRTTSDYLNIKEGLGTILNNYVFAGLAGVIWYCQFMFYGMGTTRMGKYDFSSWTIHMAFIIVFSNIWGIIFHEWKGAGKKTHWLVVGGILVLVASTIVVGYGNYLGSLE